MLQWNIVVIDWVNRYIWIFILCVHMFMVKESPQLQENVTQIIIDKFSDFSDLIYEYALFLNL